jgi:hypothetical protein
VVLGGSVFLMSEVPLHTLPLQARPLFAHEGHPEPYTLNPGPQTPNPKPQTTNPKS